MDEIIPINNDTTPTRADPMGLRANVLTILILVALILVLRLPFHAEYLTKWDSCNYAFALEHFNISDHTPHPPGYPYYIGFAAIINFFVHNANLAYIIEGIILCAIAAIFIFLTGRLLFGYTEGLFAAILFIISPSCWYLSSTALSYMADATLASSVLFIALYAHKRTDMSWPYRIMPIVLGLGAGFRIPGFILCLPLYIIHLLDLNWRRRISSILIVIIIAVAGYAWVIRATGGWGEYINIVMLESGKHGQALQRLLGNPIAEFERNIGQILLFIRESLGTLWFLFLLPLLFLKNIFIRFTREKALLCAAFAVPIIFITFIYANYTAIIFIFSPILCLTTVYGISKASRWVVGIKLRNYKRADNKRWGTILFAFLWLVVIVFAGSQDIPKKSAEIEMDLEAKSGVNEYNLGQIYINDNYIKTLIDTTKRFNPNETCLMMFMETKHAGYYLRDYQVIWDKFIIRAPTKSPDGIFSLKGGRRIMIKTSFYESDRSIIFAMPLPKGCRTLIFREDIEPLYIPLKGLEASEITGTPFCVVGGIPYGWGIVVERHLGTPSGPPPPPPTWSIGPVGKVE